MAERKEGYWSRHHTGVIQCILAFYCAVLGTLDYVRTRPVPANVTSPSPPAGVAMTHGYAMPLYLWIGIIALCLSVAIPAIVKMIRNWREPDPTQLVIHYARYGYGDWWWQFRNVTKAVRANLKDNAIDMPVSNVYLGDPTFGRLKTLRVKYSFAGSTDTIELLEEKPDRPSRLVLPSKTQEIPPQPKVAKFDGEIYRIVRSDKVAHSDLTRQLWESVNPGKEFAIDVDILVEMYVVNTSPQTQYIRDFRGSVEIDGVRIPLIRESDFSAYTIGDGHDYEYCFDQPNERLAILGGPSETLRPLFPTLPIALEERKPMEGWARFLLKERDPRKLVENRTYEFVLVDSLGGEYQISRAANPQRTTPQVTSRKRGGPGQ